MGRVAWAVVIVLATMTPLDAIAGDAAAGTGVRADEADEAGDQARSSARDYLEFSNTLNSDCMLYRARLRRIENTHPDKPIRVVLVSYTGNTRSQGDSELLLRPDSEPQPLGCNGTSGLKRRWEIKSAEFAH